LRAGRVDKTAEVAIFHGRSWYGSDLLLGLVEPEPIGTNEKEGTVLAVVDLGQDYRAVDGKAGVVLLVHRWCGSPIRSKMSREKADRIEKLISQNVKAITMKGIRTGCHVICNSTLSQTIFRFESCAIHTELIDHFVRRINVCLDPLVLHKGHGNSVKLDFVLIGKPAIDVVGRSTTLYSRSEIHERVKLPCQSSEFEWGRFHEFGFQGCAEGGRLCIQ